MMTPCMISDLSLPTKDLKSSLPICLFFANILECRIDRGCSRCFEGTYKMQDLDLSPVRETKVGDG